jgi:TonB family protein
MLPNMLRRGLLALAVVALSVSAAAQQPTAARGYMENADRKFRAGDLQGAIAELTQAIALDSTNAETYVQRGFMRILLGALDGALADFNRVVALSPDAVGGYAYRGTVKLRMDDMDGAIADAKRALALSPSPLLLPAQTLMLAYWNKAVAENRPRDTVSLGLSAADTVLRIQPDDVEALVVKGLFLRYQAISETESSVQVALIRQAESLRAEAEAVRTRPGGGPVSPLPPVRLKPPPPPPPPPGADFVPPAPPPPPDAVRVGGAVRPPVKLKHVDPAYPPIAQAAKIQGVVIIDATIGGDGKVINTTVLRSIPLLDQAAIDAVKQWEFTPTLLNSVPTAVLMTVTVQFTLQ